MTLQAQLEQLIAWHQTQHPEAVEIWAGLMPLQAKLTNPVWQIAVLGQVSRGKSALINALVGQPQFRTGPTHGITLWPHSVRWHPEFDGQTYAIDLTDTPGLDEWEGETRAAMAWEIAQQSDLVLFVTAGPLNPVELAALKTLCQNQVSLFLVANKQDLYLAWTKADLDLQLQQAGLGGWLDLDQILPVSADPVAALANLESLRAALAHWLQTQALETRTAQILRQARQIEQTLGQKLLAKPLDPWLRVGIPGVIGGGLLLCPWAWGDLILGLIGSFGLVRGLCRAYGIPLMPPASTQAWRIILLTTAGIGLLGPGGWAWLWDLSSGTASIFWGGTLTQGAIWAWGIYRLQQIIRKHTANGYPLG